MGDQFGLTVRNICSKYPMLHMQEANLFLLSASTSSAFSIGHDSYPGHGPLPSLPQLHGSFPEGALLHKVTELIQVGCTGGSRTQLERYTTLVYTRRSNCDVQRVQHEFVGEDNILQLSGLTGSRLRCKDAFECNVGLQTKTQSHMYTVGHPISAPSLDSCAQNHVILPSRVKTGSALGC